MKTYPWLITVILVSGFLLQAQDVQPQKETVRSEKEKEKEKDGKAQATHGAVGKNGGKITTPTSGTAQQGNSDKSTGHHPGTTHDNNTSGGRDGYTQGGPSSAPSGK
jgi:hypothetical protein